MTKQFFVRVQLNGVEESDDAYQVLADEMAARGFAFTIALPKRSAKLPVGAFFGAAETAGDTSEEALRRAQLAVKATGLAAAIVVVETTAPVQTFGLDMAPRPADAP